MPMQRTEQERRIQTACLLILTSIALGAALYYLRPVLIPFVLAIFAILCLAPVIDVQVRYLRINRRLALVSTMILGCLGLVLTWLVIWSTVSQMSQNAGQYEAQVSSMLENAAAGLPLEKLGIKREDFASVMSIPRETTRDLLAQLISSIMSVFSNGLLVLVFMIFMMAGTHRAAPVPGSFRDQVESKIKTYIAAKVFVSAITAVLIGAILAVLGVRFWLAFGMLTFLLNFIPSIGSVIAWLLPLPVVVLDPQMTTFYKTLVFALPLCVHMIMGYWVEPKLMGRSLDLHPVTVMLGLIFFGMIWGIMGMFLATPIVALIKIILDRLEVTAPVGAALAGNLDAADEGVTAP